MKILFSFFVTVLSLAVSGQAMPKRQAADFVPKGYVLFERIDGDLNGDGVADCVLIIKGTDKSKVVIDDYQKTVDRNRRGILVPFKKKDGYVLVLENKDCFSSENEDGGVYFPPELSVEVGKGNLYIHYGYGRYGFWTYTFRYRNADFELIGYDESEDSGPVVNSEVSVNFLTGKKLVRVNVNENAEGGYEVFRERWERVRIERIRLSGIRDFDEIEREGW